MLAIPLHTKISEDYIQNLVFTSHRAQCASITNETQFVLFMEINAVFCENDTKSTMTGMHRFQILNVRAHPRKWLLNKKTVCAPPEQQTYITYQ
jgi:hypothetical protein